jgi:hypothetical protein
MSAVGASFRVQMLEDASRRVRRRGGRVYFIMLFRDLAGSLRNWGVGHENLC